MNNLNLPDIIETWQRPELLQHPNIPKPLHGMNPRSILGQKWWDVKRKEAYAHHNYRCWACGIHKRQASMKQWLEGHEHYEIDYRKQTVAIKEIVALCRPCHWFIHSGRTYILYQKGEIKQETIMFVLTRGFHLLKSAGLKPSWTSAYHYLMLKNYTDRDAQQEIKSRGIDIPTSGGEWQDWRLILDGEKYKPKFVSFDDWYEHYNGYNPPMVDRI